MVIKHSEFSGDVYGFEKAHACLHYLKRNQIGRETLLLLDLRLTDYNGFEFLDNLRNEFGNEPKYKVIILTSILLPEDIEKSKSYQEIVLIQEKPISIPAINQLLSLNLTT